MAVPQHPQATTLPLSSALSPHLLDRLETLQSATGKSVTRLVREAVSLYVTQYGEPLNLTAPTDRLVCCPHDATQIVSCHFDGLMRSDLVGVYLNRRGELRAVQVLATDCRDLSKVPLRVVLQPALLLPARAFLLAHHHTPGLMISMRDIVAFVRRLAQAAEVLGVVLLDYLIVAQGETTSLFVERCLTPQFNGYRGLYRRQVSETERRSLRNGTRIGGDHS